jgi:hypothetical protein
MAKACSQCRVCGFFSSGSTLEEAAECNAQPSGYDRQPRICLLAEDQIGRPADELVASTRTGLSWLVSGLRLAP